MAPTLSSRGALPGELERSRLGNGLEVCLLRNAQAPIVSTALFYRVGGRDEPAGRGGLAHFLEHMMFKGSARFAPGEVDRRTQALGGANNAFTSHDVTAYWFSFAADRWSAALEIEADRMRGLRLDPTEIEAERRVILEEIDMYRDDPWDALEMEVLAALFEGHPYGRPVLGSRDELLAEGRDELADFHGRHYRPDRAVLVVAGALDDSALARVEAAFGDLPAGGAPRPPAAPPPVLAVPRLIERRHGEVTRILWAFPAPAPDAPDHAELRLAATILAEGRASRLQHALVEDGQLCLGVSAILAENQLGSHFAIAAEVLPGGDADEVERRCAAELAAIALPVGAEELERARQVFLADWVHGLEKIHQQAVAAGLALTQFDLDQPERLLRRVREASAAEVAAAVERWLEPGRGVVRGVSRPENGKGGA